MASSKLVAVTAKAIWEAHRRQSQSVRRTPKEFSIEAASGLLNCDQCGNWSFSTLSVDSGRPLCANSGHSAKAWRTGHIRPFAALPGVSRYAKTAPRATAPETSCERDCSSPKQTYKLSPRPLATPVPPQRLGIFQVQRVETFGEQVVDRHEEVMSRCTPDPARARRRSAGGRVGPIEQDAVRIHLPVRW